MKITAEYKGKTVEIDVPDEKLEELVKEQKKTGWEQSRCGRNYFVVNAEREVKMWFDQNDNMSETLYNVGNYFTSKELAENIACYQSLDLRIRRRIAEICEPITWDNGTKCNYNICYSNILKRVDVSPCNMTFNSWCCDTKEHAKQIIEEFKDDLLWYFTEFKDRMDG